MLKQLGVATNSNNARLVKEQKYYGKMNQVNKRLKTKGQKRKSFDFKLRQNLNLDCPVLI